MSGLDSHFRFLHQFPKEKEDMTFEEFREWIGNVIRRYGFREPTEEMEKFFKNLYDTDDNTYKLIRNKFKVSYQLLKRLSKSANNIICVADDESLDYLNFILDTHKRKIAIIRTEIDNILKVGLRTDGYEKYLSSELDDEVVANLIRIVADSIRVFRELYGFLENDGMLSSFYEEEIESMASDALDEIKFRARSVSSAKDRSVNVMISDVVADDMLVKNRKPRWSWQKNR